MSTLPAAANGDDPREREISRRRWRNMMIAAQAKGESDPQQRRRLEEMRKELGIPLAEATAIAESYQREGGSITLFGDRRQRIELFRDIITMLLIDGKIEEAESKLILRIARKLDIDQEELNQHMEECRLAVTQEKSPDSNRVSARIFKRIAKDSDRSGSVSLSDSYDRAAASDRHRMQISILEEISSDDTPVGDYTQENNKRFSLVDAEDMVIARRLIAAGELVNQQVDPFRRQQVKEFQTRGRITSFLTTMAKQGLISPEIVQEERRAYRAEEGTEETTPLCKVEGESITITARHETLDHSFLVSVISIAGQADHHSVPLLNQVFDAVTDQRGSAGRLILLDLSQAEYISSASIGVIIACRAKVHEKWGDIRFLNLSKEVEDVIRMLGVDSLIVSTHSLNEALWSFADFAGIHAS